MPYHQPTYYQSLVGKPLTDDEWDIMKLRAEGYSIREIAKFTGSSYGAVDNRIKRAYKKLDIGSLPELVTYVTRAHHANQLAIITSKIASIEANRAPADSESHFMESGALNVLRDILDQIAALGRR